MERGGEERSRDSTHLAVPPKVAQMEMCEVLLPVNSLCLKSRLNVKVSGGHMGTCFSIFFLYD